MGRYVLEEEVPQDPGHQLRELGPATKSGNWISDTFGSGGNFKGSIIGGVIHGMANPVVGAAQLGAHALGLGDKIDPLIATREAEYQAARAAAGRSGFDAAQLVGDIVSPANLAMGGAGRLASAPSMLSKILTGAALGAAGGALAPVASGKDQQRFWANKGEQAVTGSVVGGAIPAVVKGVRRVISPAASVNGAVNKLLGAGIRLTPGQALGGIAARTEDKARSFLGLGDAITAAQRRGEADLNMAVINGGLELVGPMAQMPSRALRPGHDGITQLRNTTQIAYNNLVPHLHADLNDTQFYSNIQLLRNHIAQMPQQEQDAINHIIDREVGHRMDPAGRLIGTDLQDAMSAMRDHAASFGRSSSKYERDAGEVLKAFQVELRDLLERTNPQYANEFAKINTAYRILKTVDRAASSVASPEGVFTPSQFHSAVKAGDFSKDKRAFSEGGAFLQNLSGPAKTIMSSHYNDSGTAGRLALSAGAVASGFASPAIPLALLGASAMYVPGIQKHVVNALTRRPDFARPLSDLLNVSGTYVVPGAAAAVSRR